jgi:hypothetical protein
MKLNLPCQYCAAASENNSESEILFGETDLRDDGVYTCQCPKGHLFSVSLMQQHFEMLFELGVNAAIDGYYREAVSNFAASLERFYEFSLNVFMVSSDVTQEQWDDSWKKVKNMSERQLGAYVFMHMAWFKEPAQLLSSKQSEFRNGIVHKGKIPTLDEALAFGETVREIIIKGSIQFYRIFSTQIRETMTMRRHYWNDPEPGTILSYITYPTILDFNEPERTEADKIPLIDIVKKRRAEQST